jgi:hypothetical protein
MHEDDAQQGHNPPVGFEILTVAAVTLENLITWTVAGLGGVAALYVAFRAPRIERLRSDLQRELVEHDVRFSRLHERRIEVISDIYRNLICAERAFASWTHPLQMAGQPDWAEKGTAAAKAGTKFVEHFQENRIWLEAALCEQVQKVADGFNEAFVKFTIYDPNDPNVRRERLDKWMEAWKGVSKDVPPVREDIEDRVRVLLGVTPGARQQPADRKSATTPPAEAGRPPTTAT